MITQMDKVKQYESQNKIPSEKKNYEEKGVVDLDGREIRVMLERVFK